MLRLYITVDQVISIIFCSVPLWWWCPHFMFFFFLDKEATKALYTKTKKPFWWDVDRAHLSTVTLISKRLYQNGGEAFWQEWRERSVPGTSCLWLSGTRVFLFVFVFFFTAAKYNPNMHASACKTRLFWELCGVYFHHMLISTERWWSLDFPDGRSCRSRNEFCRGYYIAAGGPFLRFHQRKITDRIPQLIIMEKTKREQG